jgi:hypothetical protein
MKTNSIFFKGVVSKGSQMNPGAFIFLLLLTICQVGSINAQTVPSINWIQQFGSTSADICQGVSAWENIYLSGYTAGSLPGQTFDGTMFDPFVAKYDPSGNTQWISQYGTGGVESGYVITADASGAYTAGVITGAFPGQTSFGLQDIYIRKYDHNGTELWTQQFGTSSNEAMPDAITVDATGVYTVGQTTGSLPGFTNAGGTDFFIVKFSLDGNYLWSIQTGTTGTDNCYGIFADESGLYACGRTTGNLYGHTNLGLADAFIAKYTPDGDTVWTRQFGTALTENGYEITGNETGLYMSGATAGIFPGQVYAGGSNDAYLVKYDREGNQLWLREYGTGGTDVAYGVSTNISGVCLAGFTTGTFPGQLPAVGNDIFAIRYNNNGDQLWLMQLGSAQRPGSTATPHDYANGVSVVSLKAYIAGYTNGILPGTTSFGGSDAYLIDLLIQTPQEATQDLITEVGQLVAAGFLNQGQGNSLVVKLQNAIKKMNQGNYNAAINLLNAFINEVTALYNAGILPGDDAEGLIVAAERIITVLESMLTKQGGEIVLGVLPTAESFRAWNYPNPVNYSTTINYSLPADMFVTLAIYDLNGKEVSVLVNGQKEMGRHQVQWNVDGIPAGVYFYRLSTADNQQSAIGKLVVVK